jgi:hypothetical protein
MDLIATAAATKTVVKAAVQPEIETSEMASLPAAVTRAADREL